MKSDLSAIGLKLQVPMLIIQAGEPEPEHVLSAGVLYCEWRKRPSTFHLIGNVPEAGEDTFQVMFIDVYKSAGMDGRGILILCVPGPRAPPFTLKTGPFVDMYVYAPFDPLRVTVSVPVVPLIPTRVTLIAFAFRFALLIMTVL